ncbi:Lsr2 family protein [Nocardia sp. NPDC059246]|uniref:histone-like nucleoid-structuring protein Lsr2 n=1 Tax=unclassified Nocardia TaxID=2637762 RepID=UPI0036B4E98F
MAKKVIYVDDLSDEPIDPELGGGPLPFMWDGEAYVIDLGLKNRDKYTKMIAPLIEKARKPSEDEMYMFGVGAGRRSPARGPKPGGKPSGQGSGRSSEALAAVREWARKQEKFKDRGISDRGKVAGDILEAYDAAHGS